MRMRIKRKHTCALNAIFNIKFAHAGWKYNFGQNDRYEIHTGFTFMSPLNSCVRN